MRELFLSAGAVPQCGSRRGTEREQERYRAGAGEVQGGSRRYITGVVPGRCTPRYIPSLLHLSGYTRPAPPAVLYWCPVRAVTCVTGERGSGLCSSGREWAGPLWLLCRNIPVKFRRSAELSFRAELTTIRQRSDVTRVMSDLGRSVSPGVRSVDYS